MHTLIPLTMALILINHKKIKDDSCYRISVFSLVGITYFFTFRFIDFYFSIFNHEDFLPLAVKLSAALVIVGVCLSPLVSRSSTLKAGICVSLLVMSLLGGFGLERQIKNVVAASGGYFDQTPVVLTSSYSGDFTEFTSDIGGFSLRIPAHWDKHVHDVEGNYFTVQRDGSILAELRPRCFHESGIVMAEVVNNLRLSASMDQRRLDTYCFEDSNNQVCLVKSIGAHSAQPLERWRWLVMNSSTQQNIDIDVLLFTGDSATKDEVHFVISSLTTKPLPRPMPVCLSTMEWF